MNNRFQRVAIFSRVQNERHEIKQTLKALTGLLKTLQVDMTFETDTASLLPAKEVHTTDDAFTLCKDKDLLIVIGGDGSLLQASRMALRYDVPILGINRGRLGFLTDILPDEMTHVLPEIIHGQYDEEHRFLLHTEIQHDNQIVYTATSLNDTVLLPGAPAHMIEFDIHVNQRHVCTQRADGVIVATPTGSTAYALSAGGPILHPNLDDIVLVPMFPHTLSSRPIVVSGSSQITLKIAKNNNVSPQLSCDGLPPQRVHVGDQVTISKHTHALRLIHPKDYDYYSTLRAKLGWETQ